MKIELNRAAIERMVTNWLADAVFKSRAIDDTCKWIDDSTVRVVVTSLAHKESQTTFTLRSENLTALVKGWGNAQVDMRMCTGSWEVQWHKDGATLVDLGDPDAPPREEQS